MKQYNITSQDLGQSSENDANLSPDDPIYELKTVQYLAGLNSQERLNEYRAAQQTQSESNINISHTGTEKARIQREQNIRPGTPEWFRLWFSLPYLNGPHKLDKKR